MHKNNKYIIIALTLIIAINSYNSLTYASENDYDHPVGDKNLVSYEPILEVLQHILLGMEVNKSPIMRQIACQIGFQPYSKSALMSTLKVTEIELGKGLRNLKQLKLITVKGDIVQAADDYSADRLRRWSRDWCLNDQDCAGAQR